MNQPSTESHVALVRAPRRLQRAAGLEPKPEPERDAGRAAPTPQRNRYATLIVSCRRGAQLSRSELGERIGVPEATIRLWEHPDYEGIDLAVLERVARASDRTLHVSFVRPRHSATSAAWSSPLERTA